MPSLQRKRVLVTRPPAQYGALATLLETCGAQPIPFPTITIEPLPDTRELDAALQNLKGFNWLVLTSVNGVAAVWDRLTALGIPSLPADLRLAAIGPKTAAALSDRGIIPEFVPDEYVAEAILPGLGDLRGQRVLLLRADRARATLPDLIRSAGGEAQEITAYYTRLAAPEREGLAALRVGVDAVLFTSPSTVHNFILLCGRAGLAPASLPGNPVFAAIGPITAAALRDYDRPADVVATTYTAEGLVTALADHLNRSLA